MVHKIVRGKQISFRLLLLGFLLLAAAWQLPVALSLASDTPDPMSITIEDDVWQGTFSIPAGIWQYKVVLNDSWVENYGYGGQRDGPNISLSLAGDTDVKFYYDHKTHWVTDNVNSVIRAS
jgi:hypothetical protein